MSDIGIIIVTYNSAAEIGACLDAALASGADIVVVDNASRDGNDRGSRPARCAFHRQSGQPRLCGAP